MSDAEIGCLMERYYVFVLKGKVRDFDDIYEGMIPAVIASANHLAHVLGHELDITEWTVLDDKKLSGKNTDRHIEITMDQSGNNGVRLFTVTGITPHIANELAEKFNLALLE